MSTANSTLDVPNEILEIIINELALHREDNNKTLATLASCRLACPLLSCDSSLFFIHTVDRL